MKSITSVPRWLKQTQAIACLLLVGAAASFADAPLITIPGGIDMSAYIVAAIALVGGIIGTCLGGYFAFQFIRVAVQWANLALGKAYNK